MDLLRDIGAFDENRYGLMSQFVKRWLGRLAPALAQTARDARENAHAGRLS
jgi:hypothetical protein